MSKPAAGMKAAGYTVLPSYFQSCYPSWTLRVSTAESNLGYWQTTDSPERTHTLHWLKIKLI